MADDRDTKAPPLPIPGGAKGGAAKGATEASGSEAGKAARGRGTAAASLEFCDVAKDEAGRQKRLAEVPEFSRRKAELISAHFLLSAGSTIVDMGFESAEITYLLALLNPRAQVIGTNLSPEEVESAKRSYRLANLSFQLGDATNPPFADGSIDAILNSNILHVVYSDHQYNPAAVSATLANQVKKLKPGGTMLIRDYMMPPQHEYVLLELPREDSAGETPQYLSDADLLIRFSHTARPHFSGGEGFFLEELEPRQENTRLFRMQHKWALEFIHRKDHREYWEQELRQEYTFYTYQDYQRELAKLGMRLLYSAPYRNPWVVRNIFEGRFRLYAENGEPMAWPATNYFLVLQKLGERKSLILEERRPSAERPREIELMTVRDKKSGKIHEIVKRRGEMADVIPYRLTQSGRLVIYVKGGYPRPIVNAVARGTPNLDGKRWSGHLVEPLMMDTSDMTDDVEANKQMIFDFVRNYAKLRVYNEDSLYIGGTFYPAPDFIEESIEPIFLQVDKPDLPEFALDDPTTGFSTAGTVKEIDAADILRAAQIGLLPDARLELHVLELMQRCNLKPQGWLGEVLPVPVGKPETVVTVEELLSRVEEREFVEEKKLGGILRPVRSVFVDEGTEGGITRSLATKDIEFVVHEDGTENIAVVVPLTRSWDGMLLMAVQPEFLPIPQRLGGAGAQLAVPSFVLPKTVRTIDDAKAFVAQKFGVTIDRVGQLGESYFCHAGVTPRRIYPFVVATDDAPEAGPNWVYTYARDVWRLIWTYSMSVDALKIVARMHLMLGAGHDMHPGSSPVTLKHKEFAISTEKTELSQAAAHQKNAMRAMRNNINVGASGGGGSGSSGQAGRRPPPEMLMPLAADAAKTAEAQNAARKRALSLQSLFSRRRKRRSQQSLAASYSKAVSEQIRAFEKAGLRVRKDEITDLLDESVESVGQKLAHLRAEEERAAAARMKEDMKPAADAARGKKTPAAAPAKKEAQKQLDLSLAPKKPTDFGGDKRK